MGFNEIEKDFIFVAFDRTIKETDANMYNRIKKLISFLSLKYSFVIYDNPEYLTKEEGLELTKNCLYGKKSINKRLKTILFIMDNSPIEEGTSLDLCYQFCLDRDREFNEKRKNNIFYGAGFSRYIISTCENPNDVITFLNTERRFYDPKNIACSLKAESPKKNCFPKNV